MPTRERSPNYPAHSLPAVVEFARAIFAKEKMSEAPPAIIVRAMGHESLNGAARTKLASLRQYGLMEGRGDNLRLTDRAFEILHSPNSKEVAQAMSDAAYTPSLFAEIHVNKPDASDEAIEYWLRRERKFSGDGASKAVRAYRDTTASLSLAPIGYNGGDGKTPNTDPSKEKPLPPNPPGSQGKPSGAGSAGIHSVTGLMLEGGTIADLSFSGSPLTREGIDMLVDYLKLTRRALPETPEPEAPRLRDIDHEDGE